METNLFCFEIIKIIYICNTMTLEKDWILENIKKKLNEKQVKVETISKEIGISKGEFSKILSGQRKDYYKYLPQIAAFFGVTFHQLVTPDQVILNNYGEVKEQSQGNVAHLNITTDKVLYERLIEECKNKDKTKDELIQVEREAKENYKRKYEKMKLRVIELENQLKQ